MTEGAQTLEQAPAIHRARQVRWMLIKFLAVLAVIATTIAYFQTPLNDRREDCQHRMEQIAAATLHFAMEHDGIYPTDLQKCPELGRLNSRYLICPNSSLEANPPRAAEIIGALHAHEAVSYIYVGAGLKDTHATNVVIWLEAKGNHDHGINVALADGAVQWIEQNDADRVLAQLSAGTRPVIIPVESTTRP